MPAGPSHGHAARKRPRHFTTIPDGQNREKRDKMHQMQPVKAHVRNGRYVSDELADLPEGTPVNFPVVEVVDPLDDMTPEERAELEEEIEAGYRDFENGDVVDGIAFAEQLLANTK